MTPKRVICTSVRTFADERSWDSWLGYASGHGKYVDPKYVPDLLAGKEVPGIPVPGNEDLTLVIKVEY